MCAPGGRGSRESLFCSERDQELNALVAKEVLSVATIAESERRSDLAKGTRLTLKWTGVHGGLRVKVGRPDIGERSTGVSFGLALVKISELFWNDRATNMSVCEVQARLTSSSIEARGSRCGVLVFFADQRQQPN